MHTTSRIHHVTPARPAKCRFSLAFSLVELSIVLVILGLLVGGVLTGQSLIRASELRAQMQDFQAISTAHYTFKDKYFCAPGDCATITQFFPTVASGNGDGRVDCWPSSGTNECATYWTGLESSGLVNPLRYSTSIEYRKAKISNTSFLYVHFQDRYAGGGYTPWNLFGQGVAWIHLTSPNWPAAQGPALKPEDAWNYDQKIDDGRPHSGMFLSADGGQGGAYLDCETSGAYSLTVTTATCRSLYKVE